ncbi:metal dependent phosphohydrolase [Aulographum hederae CBS 113979]|uniref:Metal dependent phosphohydrolase n=1 Tax=Aulographum hederae CBS 113979 TaxID=1176131 RepID=A0A6G1H5E9_9PEZI|nr:metal dependent phosphohydrolase [Aulographum hederae CBS 113979]
MASLEKVAYEQLIRNLIECKLPEKIATRMRTSRLCYAAYELAKKHLAEELFNHSVRVFCYANFIYETEKSHLKGPDRSVHTAQLLFVACLLHDIGTTEKFNGSARFEVEGADAAADLLRKEDIPEDDVREVWIAIATHTCAGIAERIGVFARLLRKGVVYDFRPSIRNKDEVMFQYAEVIERYFRRMEVEKVLGDAVVKQALNKPRKAPAASWPGCLVAAHNEDPDHQGVNPAF